MPGCAVPCCRSHTNIRRELGVIFHCFPSDSTLSDVWWQRIRRLAEKENVKDKRVCSMHFMDEDYERDLRWELLNPGKGPMENPKRMLKPTAVPSVLLEVETTR